MVAASGPRPNACSFHKYDNSPHVTVFVLLGKMNCARIKILNCIVNRLKMRRRFEAAQLAIRHTTSMVQCRLVLYVMVNALKLGLLAS